MAHGTPLENISGIAYIDQNGYKFKQNAQLLRIDNLDKLPFPDRTLLPIEHYETPATAMGIRGCIAHYEFYASGAWGG